MNNLLLQALHCSNHGTRPPVWLMRQAGRYMPQYRKIKERYSFLDMLHSPELAAEITLLPIHLLSCDAAILFSDILIILEALEMGLYFKENIGPIIEKPLSQEEDVYKLPSIDVKERLSYVSETIRLLIPQLQVPLIGFSGAPFTLASYMIEGKSSKDLKTTRRWMYNHPQTFHLLLQKLTNIIIEHLETQICAGVQALQIFDTWASILSPQQFTTFVFPYLKQIIEHLRPSNIPIIFFCRGSSSFLTQLATLSPHALSLDWSCEMASSRSVIPNFIALQGNIDPCLLYAPRPTIKKVLYELLDSMQNDPGYICNLGHGIGPDVNMDNVKYLVDAVKEYCPTSIPL